MVNLLFLCLSAEYNLMDDEEAERMIRTQNDKRHACQYGLESFNQHAMKRKLRVIEDDEGKNRKTIPMKKGSNMT